MLQNIIYNGSIYQVDTADLKTEFNQKYSDRFTADQIFVISPEEGKSMITGKASPLNGTISTFGLNINSIDFVTRQVQFTMQVTSFECVRQQLIIDTLHERKQSR